jgi:hypothetical protein
VGLWPCRAVEVLINFVGRETSQAVRFASFGTSTLYFLFYDMNTIDGWMDEFPLYLVWYLIQSGIDWCIHRRQGYAHRELLSIELLQIPLR